MNTEPTRAPSKTATPEQAGAFSLGAAALRLLPSFGVLPFNYSPVGGLAVFAGARVRAWLAYVLPLAVMVVSDMVLWAVLGEQYSPLHVSRPLVYASFLLYVVLGRWLVRYSYVGLGAASLMGSVQFFLITNFAAWLELSQLGLYPRTLDGLTQAYAAGLPFFPTTLASDLCFTFAFVGLSALLFKLAEPRPQPQEAQNS